VALASPHGAGTRGSHPRGGAGHCWPAPLPMCGISRALTRGVRPCAAARPEHGRTPPTRGASGPTQRSPVPGPHGGARGVRWCVAPAQRLAKHRVRARATYPLSGVLVRRCVEVGRGFRPVTPHPFILPSARARDTPGPAPHDRRRRAGTEEPPPVPPDGSREEEERGEMGDRSSVVACRQGH